MDGLAAITFTENAAAELRNRVREALESATRGHHGGRDYEPEQAARCQVALTHLDDAAITTLHGFAARLLADVPIEAGLPPGFAVSDAITARLRATAAWRTFLDDLLDDPTVADHLLAGLTLDLRLDQLRSLADAFAANWDLLEPRPFRERPLPRIDATAVLEPLRRAASYAAAGPAGDRLTDYLNGVIAPLVDELAALTQPLDILESLYRQEISYKAGVAKAWEQVGLSKTDVVDHLKQAAKARGDLLASVGAAVTETLSARVQEHVLTQARHRREEGRLDFHDLLVLSRDVLRSDAAVRRRMHDRFSVLLIDEFQDTDPLQVEIASLIAGDCDDDPEPDWTAIRVEAGRLFFVGDPKQSIYRFRRANISIYVEVGDRHSDGLTRLDVNFRSLPGIIAAVNVLFAELIGAATMAQVPYSDLVGHRAASGGSDVTLLGGPVDLSASQLRETEAEHIAATIVRAKTEAWPVGTGRPASFRDIAILLPTRASLTALEAALQSRDVPYRVESRSLVWATDAVRDLVTLLQAVDNPADEVATVAALRHPGLACSDVDLADWAASGGRWNYLAPVPDGVDDDHPVAAAMAALRGYHDLRWWLPVNELLDRVVTELRLVELTAELRRPRDHWRRLRFLVDQARAFCDAGGSGLSDFVAWAVDQTESEADVLETVVPEPDDDAVRILTVHGSKGLEFPVTIVAGLGAGARSGGQVLWGGPRPEVRLKARALETPGYGAQADVEKRLDHEEAVRLLYVAATRAQDHLILGCYHKPAKSGDGSHAQQVYRLLGHNPALATVEPAPVEVPAPAPTQTVVMPPPVEDRATFVAERSDLLAAVRRRVATSATALAQDAAAAGAAVPGEPVLDPPDPGTVEIGGTPVPKRRPARTGAALGTAVHRVLELVDLASGSDDEVARLARQATEEQEIPALAGEVAARVRGVLASPLVVEAARHGRYWREVYVIAQDGERYVEGYVDLLVETADGALVIVDYKTDQVTSETLPGKVELYRPQLAAYGRAAGLATGRVIDTGVLIFASPTSATEVPVSLG